MIPQERLASPQERLADTVRDEGRRVLATLIRTLGDLQLAEDAVQEAAVAALRAWPAAGVPDDPRAWLTVTARNKAYDMLRRWDHAAIAEASALLADAVRRSGGAAGPYQLQAHLAACHAVAPSWPDTDWDRIIGLYDRSWPDRQTRPSRSTGPWRWRSGMARLPGLPHWTASAGCLARICGMRPGRTHWSASAGPATPGRNS